MLKRLYGTAVVTEGAERKQAFAGGTDLGSEAHHASQSGREYQDQDPVVP